MGMIYRLTPYGKTRRALAGVPWRDLSPAEFNEAKELHPGMEEQGYFVKVEQEPDAPKADAAKEAAEED